MSPLVELKHWSNWRKKQGHCTFGCTRTLWADLQVRLEGRDHTWVGTSTRASLEEACPVALAALEPQRQGPREDWNEAFSIFRARTRQSTPPCSPAAVAQDGKDGRKAPMNAIGRRTGAGQDGKGRSWLALKQTYTGLQTYGKG